MIKAVIFDFDGLIVDTESLWFEAYRSVIKIRHGIELSLEEFSKVIGTNDTSLFSYIEKNSAQPIDSLKLQEEVNDFFDEQMGEPELREGVQDYLDSAKELGLKIGLASSSNRKWIDKFSHVLGIEKYFDVICTRDDVQNVKPNPELYKLAINRLGIETKEAIAFEDSLNGLIAARKAGLFCVIIPNAVTSHLPFEDFHHRLDSMIDVPLKEIIKQIEQGE